MKLAKIMLLLLLIPFFVMAKINTLYVLNVNTAITPVMASYIIKNIKMVEQKSNAGVLLFIDTPGGALESTRRIILSIINSSIPVLGYVYPDAARAASAGAFIMLACDKTAMTPLSHMGAAHPVTMGQKMSKTMQEKVVNDTVALIKSLTEKHHRNFFYAKKMVTQSISLTARECKKYNLIDYVVPTSEKFLKKLSKTTINKQNQYFSFSSSISLIQKPMTFFESIIAKVANPNLAYILLMLGFYGIIAEFSAPGIGFAGVFGSMALLLGLLGMSAISLNMTGLLFIIIAIILFILEVKFQSSGIIAIGAVFSFIFGSIIFMRNISIPGASLSPFLIIFMTILTIFFFVFILFFAVKSQQRKIKTGATGMIGLEGTALTDIAPDGRVRVHGEIWNAKSNDPIKKDTTIVVTNIHNLTVVVKKK